MTAELIAFLLQSAELRIQPDTALLLLAPADDLVRIQQDAEATRVAVLRRWLTMPIRSCAGNGHHRPMRPAGRSMSS